MHHVGPGNPDSENSAQSLANGRARRKRRSRFGAGALRGAAVQFPPMQTDKAKQIGGPSADGVPTPPGCTSDKHFVCLSAVISIMAPSAQQHLPTGGSRPSHTHTQPRILTEPRDDGPLPTHKQASTGGGRRDPALGYARATPPYRGRGCSTVHLCKAVRGQHNAQTIPWPLQDESTDSSKHRKK